MNRQETVRVPWPYKMKNLLEGGDCMETIKKVTILFLFALVLSSLSSGVPEEAIGRMDVG